LGGVALFVFDLYSFVCYLSFRYNSHQNPFATASQAIKENLKASELATILQDNPVHVSNARNVLELPLQGENPTLACTATAQLFECGLALWLTNKPDGN
jgi:hypothetical protein